MNSEIEILKQQLKESVWKPKITTRIVKKDKEPKRKLFINMTPNQLKFQYRYKKLNKFK